MRPAAQVETQVDQRRRQEGASGLVRLLLGRGGAACGLDGGDGVIVALDPA
jgi:hypothetical protein